ncbi:MAG: Na+/H+ antiporter NhaC family protein [Candidatus Glassbacteria bacterium]
MSQSTLRINFRGGTYVSVIPIATFILLTIVLVITGEAGVKSMIIAAMFGISLGMPFATNVADYNEKVFALMANSVAGVAVICWLWTGAFSGILADSGLVEAIVWLGWKANIGGELFILAVFILSSLFAVSVGSAFATVVGFTTVMYPAGILLGAPPGPLVGAILSGAAFGDNLAPVSDTTILSAATQETDVGGVVRSRLKYSLTAAVISGFLFYIFGGGASTIDPLKAGQLLSEIADPAGLPMFIPAVIVFVTAIRGYHFLLAINLGIASALIIGNYTGVFPFGKVFSFSSDNSFGGCAVNGVMAVLPISILALLLVTVNGLMEAGGFFDRLLVTLDRIAVKSVRRAETAIVVLVSLGNLCVPGNTSAMVTTGPLVNQIRKRHGIHQYRSANLMDCISCSFPFLLPYATVIIVAIAVQKELQIRYGFIPVLSWSDIWPYVYYGIVLFPLMIVSVITGIGRSKG